MEMNGNHPNQRMRGRRGRGSGSGWRGYLLMKRGYFSHFTPHGCFGKLCAKEVSSTIYFFSGWMEEKKGEGIFTSLVLGGFPWPFGDALQNASMQMQGLFSVMDRSIC
ncbi:hypothetical protein DAI22_12g176550 [Oryza sativa Japonica Group]|nr:hypothetical protein DAI22_12g176550 [Oryza sativa Japonica Group]